jgi:hypothetical protein
MEGQGGGEAQGVADPPPPQKNTNKTLMRQTVKQVHFSAFIACF